MSGLPQQKLVCSIGVTAYNEEQNIGNLLEALIEQHLHRVEIAEIIVVASACTDRTVPIVQQFMARERVSAERVSVMRASGFREERNVLNPAEHCAGCLAEAARGWVTLGSLVPQAPASRPSDAATVATTATLRNVARLVALIMYSPLLPGHVGDTTAMAPHGHCTVR